MPPIANAIFEVGACVDHVCAPRCLILCLWHANSSVSLRTGVGRTTTIQLGNSRGDYHDFITLLPDDKVARVCDNLIASVCHHKDQSSFNRFNDDVMRI